MTMNQQMRELADFFDEHGLKAGEFFDVSFGLSSARVTITESSFTQPVSFGEGAVLSDAEKWKLGVVTIKRKLKRAFGPFVAEGKPPGVTLVGFTELDNLKIKAYWYGAFKCEITGEKEVDKTPNEIRLETKNAQYMLEQAQKDTKVVLTYDCKPVNSDG